MILIIGGTTEGRSAVKVVEEGGKEFYYSTFSDTQEIVLHNGFRLSGAMDAVSMKAFCRKKGIRMVVDAAHPFAERLHSTVSEVSASLSIPVIRYERHSCIPEGAVLCLNYSDAVSKLEAASVRRLLALTGVNTIPKLKNFWSRHDCYFRILDRPSSIDAALSCSFPKEKLLFFDMDTVGEDVDREASLWRSIAPDAVLTKDSGDNGLTDRKGEVSRLTGIPLYVVGRPPLPHYDRIVYTESGLRRAMDELLPGFFPLASGYTTGTCATVAVCAATALLTTGETPGTMTVTLPGGELAVLNVDACGYEGGRACRKAYASVVKHAGDDPDTTDGCRISATVELNDGSEIRFLPGKGVGTVTLPGLGIPVGEPAVNPVPRRMIRENLMMAGVRGADVSISVENGEELASKTFNPRLGITGGISIIGTSGIVRPFSHEAFTSSIDRSIAVAEALGCNSVILNSGARSESVLRREYPKLPPQAFVQYGNFIGEAIGFASRHGIHEVVVGLMIGKAVKLAEGHLDTHSHKVLMNKDFLMNLAHSAGCSTEAAEQVGQINFARDLWTVLESGDRDAFMGRLMELCYSHCAPLLPSGNLTMLLIDESGEVNYLRRQP